MFFVPFSTAKCVIVITHRKNWFLPVEEKYLLKQILRIDHWKGRDKEYKEIAFYVK